MTGHQNIRAQYEAADQGHVFKFFDDLDDAAKSEFIEQLSSIDPVRVNRVAETVLGPSHGDSGASDASQESITPLPESANASLLSSSTDETNSWASAGLSLISQNKVAVVLLAGGQGTRLGSSAPKGCFDIGLPSHKSLFTLQAERILSLQKLAINYSGRTEVIIPWYIMTSGPTRKPTEDFFQKNNFFGLCPSNIFFFEQGVLPCIDNSGKIMLESKGKVAVAPDGNGGIYRALAKEGVLSDLTKRGIEHIHAYCVDNCLVKMADPIFIGFAASRGVQIATKSVPKRSPTENVGLILAKNGKPAVIEYSEISEEMAHRRGSDGLLAFRTANIVNHYYSIEYLKTIPTWPDNYLPYHVAHKKIPSVDIETGEQIVPTKPNGIKLEQFIFDCFPQLDISKFANLEVRREDEFSPLKNKAGTVGEDDADTSRADLLKQGGRWVVAAGATIKEGILGVEVPPLVSYAGEGLEFVKGVTFDSVTIVSQ
ncbi:nucleotide-diphospho-sugar transferase [Dipodascopsis uninucleata]